MNSKLLASWLLAALLAVSSAATVAGGEFAGEILGNSDVIGLTRANVSEEVIVAKIRSTPNIFDLSTRAILSLKESGVSDDVIRAMQVASDRSSPNPIMDETRFRLELENIASGVSEARSGGLAWMLANREQSLPLLRRSLADARPELIAASASVLADMRDRESVPAIRNLITHPSPAVRQSAARALVTFDDMASINAAEQAVARQLSPLDGYVRLLGFARNTRSAGDLGRVLENNADAGNRVAATWALGEIGRAGTAGRPALENALTHDSDPAVRREAATAVARFHDSQSAALLQKACAEDWEVRKITLAAMAEYPETVEFLVSVLNLGPDQITADELETARNSLTRLTGQDFGLEGQRWSEWYASNRSRFPSGITGAPAPLPGRNAATASVSASLSPGPSRREVDVEAWSIVADSAGIPMAPLVDDRMPSGPLPGAFSGTTGTTAGSSPAASSGLGLPLPSAGGGGTYGLMRTSGSGVDSAADSRPAGGGVPTDIPGIGDLDASLIDGDPGGSMLRTWSSDPERTGRPAAPARGLSLPSSSQAAAPGGADDYTPALPPAVSSLPSGPVVPAMTAASDPGTSSSASGGLALPLPPMDGGGSPVSDYAPMLEAPSSPSPFESADYGSTAAPTLPATDSDSQGWEYSVPVDPYAGVGGASEYSTPGIGALSDPYAGGGEAGLPDPYSDFGGTEGAELTDPYAGMGDTVFTEPAGGAEPVGLPDPYAGMGGIVLPSDGDTGSVDAGGPELSDPYSDIGTGGIPASGSESWSAPAADSTMLYGDADESGGAFESAEPETAVPTAPDEPEMRRYSLRPPGASQSSDEEEEGIADGETPPTGTSAASSSLFVEPSPDQEVIGDALLVPDATATYAEPYQAVSPEAGATPDYYTTESIPDTPIPEAAIQQTAPAAADTFIGEPYAEPSAPVQSYETYTVPSTPARTADEIFREFSTPMPPVKEEGTVRATSGKDLPPMLGDGMLGK